jgi:hypothetical protein
MNGNGYERNIDINECDDKMLDSSQEVPSDIDSQVTF